MNEIKQKNIKLDKNILIEVTYKDEKYYPLSNTYEKVLLKSKPNKTIVEKMCKRRLKKLDVDYSYINGGNHNTYCMQKEDLIHILTSHTNIGALSVEQKRAMNALLKHFKLEQVSEKPRFISSYNYIASDVYDNFERDCIHEVLELKTGDEWQLCNKCERYLPLHVSFFPYNNRDGVYQACCTSCRNSNRSYVHLDSVLNDVYNKYGYEVYLIYKNNDIIAIYNHYVDSNLKSIPTTIRTKPSYLKIVKYLYESGKLSVEDITIKTLVSQFKLNSISTLLNISEVYEYLFGDRPRKYPWLYKSYRRGEISLDDAKEVFQNYIDYNDISIDNIFDYDYLLIARKSRIGKSYHGDILSFVVEFYDNKYPGYKFNISSSKHWKQKKHRHNALKYLIEEDMELDLEKVPLYLTMTSIKNIGTSTMHYVLKKYYKSLYDWVNDVYPDVFDPKDFDINYMRNEFDSVEEHTVHDILSDSFKNVVYNYNKSGTYIELMGKHPDWIIVGEDGCIVVEYFGLWSKRGSHNSRTSDYIERSEDKISKYKELEGYRFLYIYPEDLDDNYKGLHSKISKIKNNKNIHIVG